MTKSPNEILVELVAMADRFDQAGDFDKAAKVDTAIKSFARGRPKAPMKGLDEDVKEALVKFLHSVSKRLKASQDDLEELFRRLRYFDQADAIKPLGLEKALKDMADTQSCVDGAKERLYSMTFGGGKGGLNKLLEKLEGGGESADDMPNHKPTEFFDSRQPADDLAKDEPELEEEASPEELSDEKEALEEFWKTYEDLESFEDEEIE